VFTAAQEVGDEYFHFLFIFAMNMMMAIY